MSFYTSSDYVIAVVRADAANLTASMLDNAPSLPFKSTIITLIHSIPLAPLNERILHATHFCGKIINVPRSTGMLRY